MSRESNFLAFGSGGARCGFLFTEEGEPFPLNQRPPAKRRAATQPGGSKLFRTIGRGFSLGFSLAHASLDFLLCVGTRRGNAELARRAWVKQTAKDLLKALHISVKVRGVAPSSGLLVSNHLSYLDILVLASVVPAVFVSKREVSGWPIFGWLARCAGTIFVNRESRGDVARVGEQITRTLDSGAIAILFPEGTSSSGTSVLPFRSSLLEPVLRQDHPVSPAALDYELGDGSVENEVCYWGEMVLGPHLLNLLSKESIQATVHFGEPEDRSCVDRKQLARKLHEKVCLLRTASSTESNLLSL